jgi:predicted nucleotidyltransferase
MNMPVRTRAEALARIAACKANLRSMGVTSLQLFGSAGRDELTPASDVDALVEFERPVGAFAFMDVRDFLAGILGRDVDLVTPDAVRPWMRDRVRQDGVRAA